MAKKARQEAITAQNTAKILINVASYRHNLATLFQDFVTVAALTLQNGFEPRNEAWHAREAEYLRIVGQYDRDVIDAMAHCLGGLIMRAQDEHRDHLGELYMALGIGNKSLGQFFTPYHISRLMAAISLERKQIEAAIEKQGYLSLNEPTCGAGGIVVAAADVMRELGFDPETQLRVVAQDADRHCCRMTYVNCLLHRIPATIIWGDTLLVEEKEITHTPALFLQVARLHQNAA